MTGKTFAEVDAAHEPIREDLKSMTNPSQGGQTMGTPPEAQTPTTDAAAPPPEPKQPKKKVSTLCPIMEYFATHIGDPTTVDQLVEVTGGSRSSISGNITVLTNNRWIIIKTGESTFVCHATGSYNPDTSLRKRQKQFLTIQKPNGAKALAAAPAVEWTEPELPLAPGTKGLQPGDLLEVIRVSRNGTVWAEDGEGTLHRVSASGIPTEAV